MAAFVLFLAFALLWPCALALFLTALWAGARRWQTMELILSTDEAQPSWIPSGIPGWVVGSLVLAWLILAALASRLRSLSRDAGWVSS